MASGPIRLNNDPHTKLNVSRRKQLPRTVIEGFHCGQNEIEEANREGKLIKALKYSMRFCFIVHISYERVVLIRSSKLLILMAEVHCTFYFYCRKSGET